MFPLNKSGVTEPIMVKNYPKVELDRVLSSEDSEVYAYLYKEEKYFIINLSNCNLDSTPRLREIKRILDAFDMYTLAIYKPTEEFYKASQVTGFKFKGDLESLKDNNIYLHSNHYRLKLSPIVVNFGEKTVPVEELLKLRVNLKIGEG